MRDRPVLKVATDMTKQPVDLETAISLIEGGKALRDISVDLGEGFMAEATGPLGLQGLLQRLRGHRVLQCLAQSSADKHPRHMRSSTTALRHDVAEILDVLRKPR